MGIEKFVVWMSCETAEGMDWLADTSKRKSVLPRISSSGIKKGWPRYISKEKD